DQATGCQQGDVGQADVHGRANPVDAGVEPGDDRVDAGLQTGQDVVADVAHEAGDPPGQGRDETDDRVSTLAHLALRPVPCGTERAADDVGEAVHEVSDLDGELHERPDHSRDSRIEDSLPGRERHVPQ